MFQSSQWNKVSSTATAFCCPRLWRAEPGRKWSRNPSRSRKIPRHWTPWEWYHVLIIINDIGYQWWISTNDDRWIELKPQKMVNPNCRMCTSPRMRPQLCRRQPFFAVWSVICWGPTRAPRCKSFENSLFLRISPRDMHSSHPATYLVDLVLQDAVHVDNDGRGSSKEDLTLPWLFLGGFETQQQKGDGDWLGIDFMVITWKTNSVSWQVEVFNSPEIVDIRDVWAGFGQKIIDFQFF